MGQHAGEHRLIGRDQEQDELMQAAVAACAGQGVLVLVGGEAGIGKTSLIRQTLAGTALAVLEGAAHQGVPLPYGPLIAALRTYRAAWPDDQRLEETLTASLGLLLPELGTPSASGDRAALFEALRAAIATIARQRPTALVLDDLHWADHATLELLPALAGALEGEPLLIIGAYRSDEVPRGHPVRRLRAELRRVRRLRELTIEPLDQAQTARLAARVLGATPSPGLAAALYDRSEGVPFFVEEFAGALVASGRLGHRSVGLALDDGDELPLPDSLRDAVALKTADLPELARQALDLAAVAGLDIDLDLVAELVGSDEWLAPLVDRGLVIEVGPGRAAFRHALTREACYLDVPWARRRALHRQLAAHLAAAGTPLAVVAEHWLAGRESERAREALLVAAEASCHQHAYRDAASMTRRALELWPEASDEGGRLRVLEGLGRCASLSGELSEAARIWREVTTGYRQLGDNSRLATAQRELAGIHELQGDWEAALAAREAAAQAFGAADLPGEAATERLLAAAHLRSAAHYQPALALLALARPDADRAGRIDLSARILGLEGNTRARLGESAAGLALVHAGLALALEHHLAGPTSEIYQRLADALEHTGDYASARETYLQAADYCRTHGGETLANLCLACLTVVLRQTGEWERATAICREVLATTSTSLHARAVAGGMLGVLSALRGDARAARPLLLSAAAVAKQIELAAMELLGTWGLALVDEVNAAPEATIIARCREVLARWQETEERHYVVPILSWAASYCAEHRAEREARACAAALARIATETGQPEALAALAHALGETALLDGDAAQAAAQFGQALELLRDCQLPFDHAQTERRAGNALALAGQREAGVARLAAAYRTARNLGARPLASRIARDLLALGEPVERRLGRRAAGQLTQAGLSRRELEVLRLVAVGRTSREVGQQLYLSPRTVEMHVQSILAKLDCRSRAEATRKAAELGLLDGAGLESV